MGHLPTSALRPIFDLLLCASKYRLQNFKWALSIGELSQDLKNKLIEVPQTSLLQVNISEIMESEILQILHACVGEGFRLLKSVCRLKLKRALGRGGGLFSKRSSESVKFPEDGMQVPR